jgi:hypothetical protein
MKFDEMPPEAATSALPQRSDRRALPPPPPPPPRRPPPPPHRATNDRPGEGRSASAPERQEEAAAGDTGRGEARLREASPKVVTGHSHLPPPYALLQATSGPQVSAPPSVRTRLGSFESLHPRFDFALRLFANSVNLVRGLGWVGFVFGCSSTRCGRGLRRARGPSGATAVAFLLSLRPHICALLTPPMVVQARGAALLRRSARRRRREPLLGTRCAAWR